MTRPEDRFADLDRIPVPDQWEEIESRQPGRDVPRESRASRATTIVVALVVALVGMTAAFLAFPGGAPPQEGDPMRRPTSRGGPFPNRTVLATGETAGVAWEVYSVELGRTTAIGSHIKGRAWPHSTIENLDPCAIESDRIKWLHLKRTPERVVVLQYYAVPRETAAVRFILTDGRVLGARILHPSPDSGVPFDAFVISFEGPPGIGVSEIVLVGDDGARLDDPATC